MGGARPPLLLGALRGASGLILRSEGHRYQYRPARGLGIGGKAMAKMSESEWKASLVEKPRTGKLGTVRKDRPHVAPIWFALDDDGTILFMTGTRTARGRAIRRNRRICLCADDEAPPFPFVTI